MRATGKENFARSAIGCLPYSHRRFQLELALLSFVTPCLIGCLAVLGGSEGRKKCPMVYPFQNLSEEGGGGGGARLNGGIQYLINN